MGESTKIQWAHHTFNPWRGCAKVSEGCRFCYAEALAQRQPDVFGVWGPQGTRVIAAESSWRQPLAWDRAAARDGVRRRVFCGSMCDVFEDRDDLAPPLARLFGIIRHTQNLDWLLLTKRPECFQKRLRLATEHIRREVGKHCESSWWVSNWRHERVVPENVWIGTSVENQQTADVRIPHLLQVPARVRFLSCEPLLGPVDLEQYLYAVAPSTAGPWQYPSGRVERGGGIGGQTISAKPAHEIHWVIVGGESGPHARPCNVAWVRSLVRQCQSAKVACFVKQLGARPYVDHSPPEAAAIAWRYGVGPLVAEFWQLRDPKGGDPAEWPDDLQVRQFPEVQP